ncbi:thiamine phosphate synthase [Ammoniphilus oxalaticus]|uniref:Thiamine phosphate synthase n=1 Tax=Ammoniphilus oxalaticus TaxID=66863 RepID=A0A419SEK9_9BACL|nr:thiazole tautomerase TenI [Ammoniphilus oxalaticus]RKD21765.1 thiamine phosphate synthase [Ammoniphilus oxalaticus]
MSGPELHLISDGKKTLTQFAKIAAEVQSFVTHFHLREKAKSAKEIWDGIQILLKLGIPKEKIVVNDRVDLALAANVSGVQLAYHSLEPQFVRQRFPQLRIGCSVHSEQEAMEMERQQADYVIYGHIFESGSKQGLEGRGIEALASVVNSVRIPVIAIGGISPINVPLVLQAGAAGIAVMSGILDHVDPTAVAEQYALALRMQR